MGLMKITSGCHDNPRGCEPIYKGCDSRSGDVKDRLGGVDGTWVEEDDGFEAGILIVIYLQLLEGQDQLIKDANGHSAHLC